MRGNGNVAAVMCALALATLARAESDWPHRRGPHLDGTAAGGGVFSAERPVLEVLWQRELGEAYSGIVVAEEKAVTTFSDGVSDWLIALGLRTGEERWRYAIGPTFDGPHESARGPRSTPTIDDGIVYGVGARGELFAVHLASGAKLWSLDLVERFAAKRPRYGVATSPLVVGKVLCVQVGGPAGNAVVGFDKTTGDVLWSHGNAPVGYQSPVLADLAGRRQIVALTNRSLYGIVPETGELLWSHAIDLPGPNGYAEPVMLGADRFLLTAPPRATAFRLERARAGYRVVELWRSPGLRRSYATPVVHDGAVYGFDGDTASCIAAADGARHWKAAAARARGAIVVDGHLVTFDADGAVVVARASPEGYAPRARVQVSSRGGRTAPSFADGLVLVRNTRDIAAVAVRAAGTGR